MTDERGGATVLVATTMALLLVIGAALGVVSALVAAHRTAQAAADLAALAGAAALARGDQGCGAADELAAANGATLRECRVAGEDVVVLVRVPGPRWLGQVGDLEARARAGPGRVRVASPRRRGRPRHGGARPRPGPASATAH